MAKANDPYTTPPKMDKKSLREHQKAVIKRIDELAVSNTWGRFPRQKKSPFYKIKQWTRFTANGITSLLSVIISFILLIGPQELH